MELEVNMTHAKDFRKEENYWCKKHLESCFANYIKLSETHFLTALKQLTPLESAAWFSLKCYTPLAYRDSHSAWATGKRKDFCMHRRRGLTQEAPQSSTLTFPQDVAALVP